MATPGGAMAENSVSATGSLWITRIPKRARHPQRSSLMTYNRSALISDGRLATCNGREPETVLGQGKRQQDEGRSDHHIAGHPIGEDDDTNQHSQDWDEVIDSGRSSGADVSYEPEVEHVSDTGVDRAENNNAEDD